MHRARLINLCTLLVSITITLLLAEGMLRLAGIQYPYFTYFTVADPVLGTALRPNAEGWQTNEGEAYIKINSDGMRDHEHAKEKPKDVLRIAVIGDSFAEAPQVPIQQTFWSVLRQTLPLCEVLHDKNVEVLNFGASGYGTLQELLMLRKNVWKYDPDIVLLSFFSGNDLSDNVKSHKKHPSRPFAVLTDDGFAIDTSFRSTPFYRFRSTAAGDILLQLMTKSRVIQAINKARLLAMEKMRKQPAGKYNPAEIGLDSGVYKEPTNEEEETPWHIAESILKEMAGDVKRHNAEFVVMMISNSSQVHPYAEVRKKYEEELGVDDLFYPERRLQTLGESAGFAVFPMGPRFQEYADMHQVFFHGFKNTQIGAGHWNALGHRMAGEIISESLCRILQ